MAKNFEEYQLTSHRPTPHHLHANQAHEHKVYSSYRVKYALKPMEAYRERRGLLEFSGINGTGYRLISMGQDYHRLQRLAILLD